MDPTVIQLPGRLPPGPYTRDDFVSLDEDDPRELLDGHLIAVDVPTRLHEYVVARLITPLGVRADRNSAGAVYPSGYKIRVTSKRGVMPDVQFFRPERMPEDAHQALTDGRPDLAVEVISPSSRTIDRFTKLSWYASIGVPEYWVIDPEDRTLERYVLRDGHDFIDGHLADDVFKPETFPGLEIPLVKLWAVPGAKLPSQ